MLESVIQAKFIKEVKDNNLGLAVKVDSTSRRGFPDVIFVDTAGDTLYIEFKADGGRLSNHQHAIHAELSELGANVLVITGEDGLNSILSLITDTSN